MGRPGLTVGRMPEYVDIQGDCWVWARKTDKLGYGKVNGASGRLAHRVVYEMLLRAIPDGLTLDHLCRNPPCVNPDHLEPVTQAENMRRSPFRSSRHTHCRRGHEYTPDNIYVSRGHRRCRACCLQQERATPRIERTTCVNGHPFIPENRYVAPKTGHSCCRICLVANTRRYRAAAKAVL